jgi:hypothetical protein
LSQPRLTLELGAADGKPPQVLRIGETQGGLVFAAAGTSDSGSVFFLPAAAWNALIQSARAADQVPTYPFAP